MSKKLAQIIVSAATILLAVFVGIKIGIDSKVGAVLALIACGIALVGVEIHYGKKYSKITEHIMYIGEDSVKLYKRSEVSAKQIYIQPVHKTYTKYNPSQLVYTGATVGGIHTGGFHTTQAYLSERSEGASGKYMAFIKDREDKEQLVVKIVLADDSLLKEAKSDPVISKFLKEDYIYLKKETADTKLTEEENYILRQAVNSNDYAMQQNITQRAFLATLLTKAEHDAIRNWISGKAAH